MTGGSPGGPGGPSEAGEGGGARSPLTRSPVARSPIVSVRRQRAKNPPQRATIACAHCRRSKVKCLNNNDGQSPCTNCLHNGRSCTYPEVTQTATKRSAEPPGIKSEQPDRKRPRRVEDIAKTEGILSPSVIAEEVLSVSYLDQALWGQLFEIYKLHFSTELPFLHLATLKQDLNMRAKTKQSDASPDRNLVLLGILALTARFSLKLVAYATAPRKPSSTSPASNPTPEDASMASAYYADVLTKALGGLKEAMTNASIERVQAFLMLGLYEWSQVSPKAGGMAAWMYIGNAIRMAMALGLNNGDRDAHKLFRPKNVATTAPSSSLAQWHIITAKEIRRRTMFSCFVLDRLLGCGKDRVLTIRSDELRIQLPCDERDFGRSTESFTGWLDASAGDTRSANLSLLGCFVRMVDLWGDISKWSFAGGRFTEEWNPPWSPTTQFYLLRQRLNKFFSDLPDCFAWSQENFFRNDTTQDVSIYVSLHVVGALCKIMLYREYIPFIPLRCSKPVGPLDDPTFIEPADKPGFWEDIADEVFGSARVIADLVDLAQNKLPMSSLVCFAVWTAAYVGIYAIKFPHMDVQRRMLPSEWPRDTKELKEPKRESEKGPTGSLYETLRTMTGPLKMASTYVRHFNDFDHYYDKIKSDYCRSHASRNSAGESKLSLRLGGSGGGLEEWKEQGLKVVNNGEILALESDKQSSRGSTIEPGTSIHSDYHISHHNYQVKPASSFTPINGAHQHSSPPQNDSRSGTLKTENIHSPMLQQHPLLPQQQPHPHPPPAFSGNSTASPQITHDMAWDISIDLMDSASFMAVYMQQTRDGVSDDFLIRHIDTYQSQPWIDAPGGNCFAYGAEFYPSPAGSCASSMVIERAGSSQMYYPGYRGGPSSGTGGVGGGGGLGGPEGGYLGLLTSSG